MTQPIEQIVVNFLFTRLCNKHLWELFEYAAEISIIRSNAISFLFHVA